MDSRDDSRDELIGKYVAVRCSEAAAYTGKVARYDSHLVLTEAYNVIEWGTERGFGQLAVSGTTASTELGDCGTCFIPAHAVITIMPCKTPLKP